MIIALQVESLQDEVTNVLADMQMFREEDVQIDGRRKQMMKKYEVRRNLFL